MEIALRKPAEKLSLISCKERLLDISLKTAELNREAKTIEAEILNHCESDIADLLKAKNEPFGSVNFTKDGVSLAINVPKKVDWDQEKLAATYADIKANGSDPSEYMTVEYGVPEAKYKAWPEVIRKQFEPARTVTPGKAKLTFKGEGE